MFNTRETNRWFHEKVWLKPLNLKPYFSGFFTKYNVKDETLHFVFKIFCNRRDIKKDLGAEQLLPTYMVTDKVASTLYLLWSKLSPRESISLTQNRLEIRLFRVFNLAIRKYFSNTQVTRVGGTILMKSCT